MIYAFLGIALQTLLSAGGLYKIKSAQDLLSFDACIGIGCYGVSFALWIGLLRWYPVSIVFPLALSVNLVVTQLVGWYGVGEKADIMQIAALGFILLGIALLCFSGKKII